MLLWALLLFVLGVLVVVAGALVAGIGTCRDDTAERTGYARVNLLRLFL